MISEKFLEKLRSAERRIEFVSSQTRGLMSSELDQALKEIKSVIEELSRNDLQSCEVTAVLFVDDEEIIRRIGKKILVEDGYEILTACDGVDALEVYEQNRNRIKCVILDLVMPRLDGMQTFNKLREYAPDLSIILTTGYSEEEISRRFDGLKLHGILRKPFSAATLSHMVKEAAGITG